MTPLDCPTCKADLRGEPIPHEWRDLYPPGQRFYSLAEARRAATHDRRVVAYKCPICTRIFAKPLR